MTLAHILIPVALEQTFTYQVPETFTVAPGDVVRVPFGAKETFGVVWTIGGDAPENQPLKTVAAKTDLPVIPEKLRAFVDWVAWYTLAPKGLVLAMAFKPPEEGRTEAVRIGVRLAGPPPPRMTPARARVLREAEGGLVFSKRHLAERAGVSQAVVDGLVDAGALEAVALPQIREFEPPITGFSRPHLTPAQTAAVESLTRLLAEPANQPVLLHGVTGSGKTEVYFEAVARTVESGRQALILMPEIALTNQFMERFAARFGVAPPAWHSAIQGRKRERLYNAVASGEVRVVAGARSALFLPFRELGLIVVDEEHEAAYKQEDGVLYHARDMAVVRAKTEGAGLILASATPSLETRANVARGRFAAVSLPERFGGRALPRLSAIDMRKDPPGKGRWLAPPLVAETAAALQRGEQALFYLNRRGYAPLTLCRACGYKRQCPDCSAWLVEHRSRRALICHLCGHTEPKLAACPECGSVDSQVPCGPGVERVAEELAELFPEARRIVLSSDLAGGNERLRSEIEAIARGEYSLVIGTQLVAKGHNFPHLSLVGVVDADVGMTSGDPRASERTFQILHQVAGRSGRGEAEGRAYLQTWQPENPVIRALLSGDEERFYAHEQQARSLAGLPPYGRLAALIVSGRDKDATAAEARRLARASPAWPDVKVLGPVEAPLALVRKRFRFRLLVKCGRKTDLQGYLRGWLNRMEKPKGNIRISVDVDPYSFL
ncbi:MAG: primosomal protein N' [Methylobacteriaceae bacterium]|jgi:primosomal protein N' (replication factor Y)|nr:primosomal protein N' [Methylobacteriaceae bacterium]